MNSRAKGQRGERAWRDILRDAGFKKAYRGQQFSGSPDSSDVQCPELPSVHFEVKHVEALNVWKAMEQAIRDAGDSKTPVLAHKRNRSGWLVTMRVEDWLELIRDVVRQHEDGQATCLAPKQSEGGNQTGCPLGRSDSQSDLVKGGGQ